MLKWIERVFLIQDHLENPVDQIGEDDVNTTAEELVDRNFDVQLKRRLSNNNPLKRGVVSK
jgi:hypothetical protein